ncbi:MAG: hypothetical protein WC480_01270 [Patescibacteria group bacterium]
MKKNIFLLSTLLILVILVLAGCAPTERPNIAQEGGLTGQLNNDIEPVDDISGENDDGAIDINQEVDDLDKEINSINSNDFDPNDLPLESDKF